MARVRTLLRLWSSEDGAELIEFALVLPLILLVVLGIAEFGFIFQRYEVITNAAREGARIAVLPGYSTADVENRVRAYVTQGRVPTTTTPTPNLRVNVDPVDIPVPGRLPISGRRVTVTYTHSYMFLPGMGAWFGTSYTTVPLTAVAEMRVEVGS